jgi:hypothetical protein
LNYYAYRNFIRNFIRNPPSKLDAPILSVKISTSESIRSLDICMVRKTRTPFEHKQETLDQSEDKPLHLPTWVEVTGRLEQINGEMITLRCSKEVVILLSSESIKNYRNILKIGSIIGILKIKKDDESAGNEDFRIRAIKE